MTRAEVLHLAVGQLTCFRTATRAVEIYLASENPYPDRLEVEAFGPEVGYWSTGVIVERGGPDRWLVVFDDEDNGAVWSDHNNIRFPTGEVS